MIAPKIPSSSQIIEKYHVILCLGHTSKLLDTVSKTSAKETSRTNCIQSLQGLIAISACIIPPMKPYLEYDVNGS